MQMPDRRAPAHLREHLLLLGLIDDPTLEQIKTRYRALCLQYHPDKTKNDETATAHFIGIKAAYEHITAHFESPRSVEDAFMTSEASHVAETTERAAARMAAEQRRQREEGQRRKHAASTPTTRARFTLAESYTGALRRDVEVMITVPDDNCWGTSTSSAYVDVPLPRGSRTGDVVRVRHPSIPVDILVTLEVAESEGAYTRATGLDLTVQHTVDALEALTGIVVEVPFMIPGEPPVVANIDRATLLDKTVLIVKARGMVSAANAAVRGDVNVIINTTNTNRMSEVARKISPAQHSSLIKNIVKLFKAKQKHRVK